MNNIENENTPIMDENNISENISERVAKSNENNIDNSLETRKVKKSKIGVISLAISMVAVLLSCYVVLFDNKGKEQNGTANNSENAERAISTVREEGASNIAYVDTEKLTSKYKFSVKLNEDFLTERAKTEASYNSKIAQFQKKYEAFMEKAKLGSFINQASMDSQQQELVDEEAAINKYDREMSQKLMERQAVITQQIYDTVINFIAEYNRDGRYSLILNSSKGSGVLYAEKMQDITEDLIKQLNERYEKATVGN
jgi:outer membrane protein